MTDISSPEAIASLPLDAQQLRKEIQQDEISLRIKKLEISKLDILNSIKKIDMEIITLKAELKKLKGIK